MRLNTNFVRGIKWNKIEDIIKKTREKSKEYSEQITSRLKIIEACKKQLGKEVNEKQVTVLLDVALTTLGLQLTDVGILYDNANKINESMFDLTQRCVNMEIRLNLLEGRYDSG